MSVALYEKRRAELVEMIGEDKVREIEEKLMDDYVLYGARQEQTNDPAGILNPPVLKSIFE